MTEQRQPIGEEMITKVMQYCDGTLGKEEADKVARQIAADPALQELADDLTGGARIARQSMAIMDNQPVPLTLARAISGGGIAARSTSPSPFFRNQIAAALVGLLLGGAAMGIWSSAQQEEGLRLAGAKLPSAETGNAAPAVTDSFRAALLAALNAGPEAHTQSYRIVNQAGSQDEIRVVDWFQLAAGTSCAEFQRAQDGSATSNGVACRRRDGGWEMILLPNPAP
jgi:hypothetical protein